MLDLFPDKGTYYDSMPKNEDDHFIIIDTFQAIQTDDMERLDKLFEVNKDEVKDILKEPGIKLNFSSYYKSENPIVEGLKNMNAGGNNNVSSRKDEIYIDCHPVGEDEESQEVTEQYDKGKEKKTQTQIIYFLVLMITVILVMALLYGINYLIKKYAD
jgi:predicted nucleic acid-binding Zn ribbon protein